MTEPKPLPGLPQPPVPTLTEEQLSPYAALALTEASAMCKIAAGLPDSHDFTDIYRVLRHSMEESLDRARNVMASYDPHWLTGDQLAVAEELLAYLRTISAASLALTAVQTDMVRFWRAEDGKHQGSAEPN